MKTELLSALLADRAAKRAVVLVTRTSDGVQQLLHPGEGAGALADAATAAVHADKSGSVEIEGETWFLNVFNPPLRLIVVGAVHIAQSLVPAARVAGYDVVVVDPRTAFATADRFPGVTLDHRWPDEALAGLNIDERTAVITLTHDPKLDDPALHVALKSPAFYIGALGSARTHGKRVDRLTAAGIGTEEIARIHAPLGLSIGAKSPAEIAISALAQMTSVLRGGKLR